MSLQRERETHTHVREGEHYPSSEVELGHGVILSGRRIAYYPAVAIIFFPMGLGDPISCYVHMLVAQASLLPQVSYPVQKTQNTLDSRSMLVSFIHSCQETVLHRLFLIISRASYSRWETQPDPLFSGFYSITEYSCTGIFQNNHAALSQAVQARTFLLFGYPIAEQLIPFPGLPCHPSFTADHSSVWHRAQFVHGVTPHATCLTVQIAYLGIPPYNYKSLVEAN